MRAVELFAGAGGASLGMAAAGVEHLACIESNADAAATLAAAGFPAVCGDVRDLSLLGGLNPDLVWSSFPCQPFSSSGEKCGPADTDRNGWPWTVDALRVLKPRWFIAENVEGITRHGTHCDQACAGPGNCAAAYLDHVILPDLHLLFGWVGARVLCCAGFGVPQRRRRLIVVAGPSQITWPKPTHGKPTDQIDLFGRKLMPWHTVREALGSARGGLCSSVVAWHTETNTSGGQARLPRSLDVPSSCPVAGGNAHGGLGVTHEDGSRRRLLPDECASIQGFPSDYPWLRSQSKKSRYKQIGNAVPPVLAEVVTRAVIAADKAENPRGFSPQN